jgi:hypothetical protein
MSEKEYNEALINFIGQQPNHLLLPTLNTGYSKLNCIYLKAVISKLPQRSDTTPSISGDIDLKIDAQNPERNKLLKHKSDLFVQRFKLSNKYHDYPYTPEFNSHRGDVSDKVLFVQKQIEEVMRKIKYFDSNGQTKPVDEKYRVPSTELGRKEKLLSLGASISRKKRDLDKLSEMPDCKERDARIEQEEKKLKELRHHKDLIIKYEADITSNIQSA